MTKEKLLKAIAAADSMEALVALERTKKQLKDKQINLAIAEATDRIVGR